MNDPEKTSLYQPDVPKSPADDAATPLYIGRYKVEKVLGKGGFGLVYLAHDDQLQRPVAIKVPHRHRVLTTEDSKAYLAEARTVANLDHPHIVPVFDVGSTEHFPCFVVSKYIDGSSLAQKIQQDRPSLHDAVELVATVGEALHFAHKQGLVHRDIKPGNILLDKSGKPFVADFGLAQREQDVGKGSRYAGTPAYMSPEQARGEGHRVDGRSDIFSLGVVFFELLVGRRPFKADSKEELLKQIASVEARPLRQYDDNIPKELERICLKALSRRASERYTTAKDMADDLRQFQNSLQQEATPKSWSSLLVARGNLSQQMEVSDQRAKVVRSTFFFADFEGFTNRVRILEKTAGHQAAAEMKRKVAYYVEEAFRQLIGEIKPADYQLIDTAGDGFFFHFRLAKDAFQFAAALHQLTTAHNTQVTDEIAQHLFRTGAATGDAAWDEGKPVGHVVNVGSRLQSASMGGDFVIDRATYDDLPPDIQQQFGPQESIRDKHDKTYDVYRTAFGRVLLPLPPSNVSNSPTPVPSSTPTSDSQPIRIVPKGLRSFDAHDADFFLELLPGPRDRDGLPDSLRFWKIRIEETDAEQTFSVGLIYGPSGCGKTSMVRAGLLPRLSDEVIAVYVEASAEETETRLLNGLRKRCPTLSDNMDLKETLSALRRGQSIPVRKKVLIVLDQFEQWLHAKKEEQNSDLVQALRQCDGGRVQCIVMVRDDFWLAVSRFLRDLEIRLVEGQNSALADLFDGDHAKKVVSAFGRAFGKFPENPGDTSKEQREFLKQAVSGLAQKGKVICVRLALFAEMMKGKAWTPATLKAVGGTEGVGVTFLEETFSAVTSPPEHRYHQKAARSVLKALLPESGTDIKGQMKSYGELLEASGYARRPKDFDDLMRILDSEIRLITPTDPEGKEDANTSTVQAGAKYYQLTHDYLVPSLRDWLTRKQKESRRGRAELLLADRAAVWNSRPENRQLPSLIQWLQIKRFTEKKNWTPPQRKMMGKAGRVIALYTGLSGLGIILLMFTGLFIAGRVEERQNANYAKALVESLSAVSTPEIEVVLDKIGNYRQTVVPQLHEIAARKASNPREQLHISLALLPVDPTQVDYLYGRLLEADPHEVLVICRALEKHKDNLLTKLWTVAAAPKQDKHRLRAASALAMYDSNNQKWATIQWGVCNDLVTVPAVQLSFWMDSLRPVRKQLSPELSAVYGNAGRQDVQRSLATDILADYAADQPNMLAELTMDADQNQFVKMFPKLKDRAEEGLAFLQDEVSKQLPPDAEDEDKEKLAKRQANAAVALLRMNQPAKVWPLLKHSPDPRARSYLIHRLSPLGADAEAIVKHLDREPDITIRRALLLSLGEFGEKDLPSDLRTDLLPKLQAMYSTDTDPGLHASAEWLLRKWKHDAWLKQVNEEWAQDIQQQAKRLNSIRQLVTKEKPPPQWYVNGKGQTMVLIPGPVEFMMGSPRTEVGRENDEPQHKKRIGRTFALSAKPVTVEQYRQFEKDYELPEVYTRTAGLPVVGTSWYQAAAYCNWLSEDEGIDKDQWCYEIQNAQVTKLKQNYLSLTGYRLPTEAEMEYAARSGSVTSRYFGETDELLEKYAWYNKNSQEKTWPVGSLKPNDLGLFDVQGNVWTWCQESYKAYPQGAEAAEDQEDGLEIVSTTSRVLRGGSFNYQASSVRSADRNGHVPTIRNSDIGFRLARTLPFAPLTSLPPTPQGSKL